MVHRLQPQPRLGPLDQSNAAAIEEAMGPFLEGDDAFPESTIITGRAAGSMGIPSGSIAGVASPRRFKAYHELAQRLADYPLLDESDYSRREYEATLANLPDAAWKLKAGIRSARGLGRGVYGWLSENDALGPGKTGRPRGLPFGRSTSGAFDAWGISGGTWCNLQGLGPGQGTPWPP